MSRPLLMGAVCYDPKVVTIWDGFRRWLTARGLPFDFMLYSHYERQVDGLIAGHIDAAWNSPLAFVRTARRAAARGRSVRPVVMRDTDRDLVSVVVVRVDSAADSLLDLAGGALATGAVDSPQATLIPLAHLAELGVRMTNRRFDVGVGLHGDHIGGERDAARALIAGDVDAACLLDSTLLTLVKEGTLQAGATRIVAQIGPYDHCVMTTIDTAPGDLVDRFGDLLMSMRYDDDEARPLLDLEGLTAWLPGRANGYGLLTTAVDRLGFYDAAGEVTARGYRP